MPNYDAAFYDPPAPVVWVMLHNCLAGNSVMEVPLLMDTGADTTLLPRNAVERLGVQLISGMEYELLSFDGSKSKTAAVELDMIFLQKAFRGRYLLTDGERGVLGRDVLASVVLLLNGPRQEWSEHVG